MTTYPGPRNPHYRHGHTQPQSREYRAWSQAKVRCYNPRRRAYKDYGGRGIVMVEAWREDFSAFLRDMGPCPAGHTLDRIDNDGPYGPRNCRWATRTEQNYNKRSNLRLTIRGETLCVTEWAARAGMSQYTIFSWLNKLGRSIERVKADLEARLFSAKETTP